MGKMAREVTRWQLIVPAAVLGFLLAPRERDERGDVPGWVMVTVMSAGLVMVIWGIAKDQLGEMVRSALNSVR